MAKERGKRRDTGKRDSQGRPIYEWDTEPDAAHGDPRNNNADNPGTDYHNYGETNFSQETFETLQELQEDPTVTSIQEDLEAHNIRITYEDGTIVLLSQHHNEETEETTYTVTQYASDKDGTLNTTEVPAKDEQEAMKIVEGLHKKKTSDEDDDQPNPLYLLGFMAKDRMVRRYRRNRRMKNRNRGQAQARGPMRKFFQWLISGIIPGR